MAPQQFGRGQARRTSRGFSTENLKTIQKKFDSGFAQQYTATLKVKAIKLINEGKLSQAAKIYEHLIKSGEKDHINHCNLAALYGREGRLDASINHLKESLSLNPHYIDAHINLGLALEMQGDPTAAINSYKTALQLNSNNPFAYNSLGNVLKEKGDLEAALTAYTRALELNQDYPDAQWNCARLMLLMGNYKNGLEKYEWRSKQELTPAQPHANPQCTQWDGSISNHTGKILLVSEQGIGDTLQFIRYAIALKQRGISISISAQENLHNLITASDIDDSPLTPHQADGIRDGKWMPLLSVPHHLGVRPDNPIITQPYLKTTDALQRKWKDLLASEQRPIIGINWQGNPKAERTGLSGRSLPLETFLPITMNHSMSLISLQKGFGSEQLGTCAFRDRFVSCQKHVDETWDFLETAAIIANCDLIITSDTSVAHLAGGMGKTTWVLLQKIPEWRWGIAGDTTFWYPSMRLFRQQKRGNWTQVLERVAEALQDHFPRITAFDCTNTKSKKAESPSSSSKQLTQIQAPISLGELIDKITILQIKVQHLKATALKNANNELAALQRTLDAIGLQVDPKITQRLKKVNSDLWQIEDQIRDKERNKDFSETFIALARSVYQKNDHRAAIKKEINSTYGSALIEKKAYQDY